MSARYAVYFSPADGTELARFGQSVLSRTAEDVPILPVSQSATSRRIMQRPRHYGFHATLKAPFELAPDTHLGELKAKLSEMTADMAPITLVGLHIREFNGFAALAFEKQISSIDTLANRCVFEFEPFRAQLGPEDYQRRQPEKLTARQLSYLDNYGYPRILAEFEFHMTLSSQLLDDRSWYLAWLEAEYPRHVTSDPVLDRLVLYAQPDRRSPFLRVEEYPFEGVEADSVGVGSI